jgi:hypothetical protein
VSTGDAQGPTPSYLRLLDWAERDRGRRRPEGQHAEAHHGIPLAMQAHAAEAARLARQALQGARGSGDDRDLLTREAALTDLMAKRYVG